MPDTNLEHCRTHLHVTIFHDVPESFRASVGGLLVNKSYSFIVKIWLEEAQAEKCQAKWRGYITSVLNGEHEPYYFEDLHNIVEFIVPYLEKMGVKFIPGNIKNGK